MPQQKKGDSLKILVLSDSHGYESHMMDAVDKENPDYCIHLGDHSSDANFLKTQYPLLAVRSVRGNCDFSDNVTPEYFEAIYGGFRILAVHGHKYGVKNSLLRISMAGREAAADVVLFGHTHMPYCNREDGFWLLNPGSCGYGGRSSYGLITISGNSIDCEIKSLR